MSLPDILDELEKIEVLIEEKMPRVQTKEFDSLATALVVATHQIAPTGSPQFKLLEVSCKWSAAPTTSQDFVVALASKKGTTHDDTLYSVDPSVGAVTSIVKTFEDDDAFVFDKGDAVTVAYTNTDTKTLGLKIKYKIL